MVVSREAADSVTPYLLPDEAAAIFRVHRRTILRWVRIGRLPAFVEGKTVRIPRDAVLKPAEPLRAVESSPAAPLDATGLEEVARRQGLL